MRQKGNLRLLMNANLWGEMQVSLMEGGKVSSLWCAGGVQAVPLQVVQQVSRPWLLPGPGCYSTAAAFLLATPNSVNCCCCCCHR